MKKQYFVLDTINPETKLYYPVVCPVGVEYDNVIQKLEGWASPYEIITAMLCDTKKRAFEVCEFLRRDHQDQGNIDTLLIRG